MLGAPIFERVRIFKDSLFPAALVFSTGEAGKVHSNRNGLAEKTALLAA